VKAKLLVLVLILNSASAVGFSQSADGGLVILKFSWGRERLNLRPSVSPLASQEELIQRSQRERELAAARNASDRGRAGRIETQIINHDQAIAKATQTELPRDGYRYKVTFRNDSMKTVKSIDWDYLFVDPITHEVVARHQFSSDENIKPGKSKGVDVLYLVPPVKTVNARLLNKKDAMPFTEQVVVARILYSDGSIWPHP
jgi:hypothetical protein